MQSLTEKLISSPLKNRIFSDLELVHLLGDSAQSRYGLVNRAMAAGEVVRIKRGLYALDNRYRDVRVHPFAIAQALASLSYVSFETALAWHGWIPEAVKLTASAIPGRKKSSLDHPILGSFSFNPLALVRKNYLIGINRVAADQQSFLIASPLRALFDLVCLRKLTWSGVEFITHGLRIDEQFLATVSQSDCHKLMAVYRHQRVRDFIQSFTIEYHGFGGMHDRNYSAAVR